MQILARFCLLIVLCSVLELYKIFLGFLIMGCASILKSLSQTQSTETDFGFGFLVIGCFSPAFKLLGLFFMFFLGLKFLQFSFHSKGIVQFLCDVRGKSSHIKNGLCSKIGFCEECYAKIVSCNKCGPVEKKVLENSNVDNRANDYLELDDDDDERECCEEDEEFNVMALRKLVKIERKRAYVTSMELEKERMAAESATDEAMNMILRLQTEKSAIEIEANNYRRLAEQKQEYDKEVIQLLQWIIMKHESQRSLLEDKLRLCRQKLKQYVNDDDDEEELDQFEGVDATLNIFNYSMEDGIDSEVINSLDMDSAELEVK